MSIEITSILVGLLFAAFGWWAEGRLVAFKRDDKHRYLILTSPFTGICCWVWGKDFCGSLSGAFFELDDDGDKMWRIDHLVSKGVKVAENGFAISFSHSHKRIDMTAKTSTGRAVLKIIQNKSCIPHPNKLLV